MYKLIYLGEYYIELIDMDNKVLFRKDIRTLNYPAPSVSFSGGFTITETCPDSGFSIETKIP